MCLQPEKNSDLWLMFAPSLLNIIKYFSVRQSLQVLVTGLNAGAFASCLNLSEYWIFLSFSFQICFDRHVAVLLALVLFLKLVLWLLYIRFQLGSLTPVYKSVCPVSIHIYIPSLAMLRIWSVTRILHSGWLHKKWTGRKHGHYTLMTIPAKRLSE